MEYETHGCQEKNRDLWKRFLKVYTTQNVQFVWVKGHADNKENNRCDFLATRSCRWYRALYR